MGLNVEVLIRSGFWLDLNSDLICNRVGHVVVGPDCVDIDWPVEENLAQLD